MTKTILGEKLCLKKQSKISDLCVLFIPKHNLYLVPASRLGAELYGRQGPHSEVEENQGSQFHLGSTLEKSRQTFSVNDQTVNIFGFWTKKQKHSINYLCNERKQMSTMMFYGRNSKYNSNWAQFFASIFFEKKKKELFCRTITFHLMKFTGKNASQLVGHLKTSQWAGFDLWATVYHPCLWVWHDAVLTKGLSM